MEFNVLQLWMRLLVSINFIAYFCSAFNGRSLSSLHSRKRLLPISCVTNENEPKVKLPILQVYNRKELISEFIVGSDFDGSLNKFQSFMSSYGKETVSQCDGQKLRHLSWPIENAYSESALDAFLTLDGIVVLKLYRNQCKQCLKLEPTYYDLAKSPEMSHIRWVQADIDNIPVFKTKMKSRLSGKAEGSHPDGKHCETCAKTGFISCNNCKHSGLVARGALTLICPECMGYKKIRCPDCGGACVNCS